METSTDCRTDEGVTVGLLDSVITLARVLRTRPIATEAECAALEDLRADEDVRALLGPSRPAGWLASAPPLSGQAFARVRAESHAAGLVGPPAGSDRFA